MSQPNPHDALWDVDPDLLPSIAAHLPDLRFLLDDLSAQTPESLHARAMTAFARLVLYCLRFSREPDALLARFGSFVDLRREVRQAPNGRAALIRIWRYFWQTYDAAMPEEVGARLLLVAGDDEKEEVVTAGEMLIERGRQEGAVNEARKTVLRLLTRRFGDLPAEAVLRVNAAELPQVEEWLDRVLVAPTLAEIFAES